MIITCDLCMYSTSRGSAHQSLHETLYDSDSSSEASEEEEQQERRPVSVNEWVLIVYCSVSTS